MRFRLAILILLSATAIHADVVKLKGGRSLRVLAVATDGNQSTFTLTTGGTMSVPLASIESIQPELIATGLCAASPYRCQDRSMLLMRQAKATAQTSPHPANH